MNPAPQPLRVLLVEDDVADAELLIRELTRAGFAPAWRRVETEADFIAALGPEWDIVLSDFHLPQFSGRRALELLRARDLELPFIVISGTIGEETAVETMRLGASDYLLKGHLARLQTSVVRALERSRLRREQLAARQAAAEAEAKYRSIFEHSAEGLFRTSADGRLVIANPALARLAGFASPEEMVAEATNIGEQFYVDPADRVRFHERMRADGVVLGFEARMRRRDGTVVWISSNARALRDAAGNLFYEGALTDITARKVAEEEIRGQLAELQRWHRVTLGREDRIIALKREVNALLAAAGQAPRYPEAGP